MNYDLLFPLVGLSGIVFSTLIVLVFLGKNQNVGSKSRGRSTSSRIRLKEFDILDEKIEKALSDIDSMVPKSSELTLKERLTAVETHINNKREKLKLKIAKVQHLENSLVNEVEVSAQANIDLDEAGQSFRRSLLNSKQEIEKVYQELPNQLCINESDEVLEILSREYDKSSELLRNLAEEYERALMQAETLSRQNPTDKSG